MHGGAVVRLRHSEISGYLASDDKDFTDDGRAEVFLWNSKQKSSVPGVEPELTTSSLFEIEISE